MENHYIGTELELFQQATNWKQYWMQAISPYIGVNLLEVGAGIGANTGILLSKFDFIETIKCVEPDPLLSTQIQNNISENLRPKCSVHTGFSSEIEPTELFDTILYIDVIEHIENDRLELENVKNLLKPNGHLIVLVPAYQYLFSEFDKAIGHYRRYNKSMLRFSAQTELVEKRMFYLDSVGFFASLMNKHLLNQKHPTKDQILLCDKVMVPSSKIFDTLIGRSFGKSLIGIWQRPF